jgi:hypothetical protein
LEIIPNRKYGKWQKCKEEIKVINYSVGKSHYINAQASTSKKQPDRNPAYPRKPDFH